MPRGKSVTKLLLDSSQAALFAGIEIHNKPHIAYRYPTASILLISAWELVLKAYIYKHVSKKQIYEADGVHTKGFSKILTISRDHINAREKNKKFQAIYDNLDILHTYRNANVHFIESKMDPIIFMLMSKAVLNYDAFVKKYFNKDITKDDNLIILPVGMKLPLNPIDYLKQEYGSAHNDFVNRVVQSIRDLNKGGVQESIVVHFDVYADSVRNVKNADIIAALEKSPDAVALRKTVQITDDPNAPLVRIEPDLPPLRYQELKEKVKEKKPNIKFGQTFNIAMRKIKANNKLCQSNYLDPRNKTGTKKDFYTLAAVDELIIEYERLEAES
ncbi:MAG: DUF3644 domain-containing protein [Thermoguttaceae bacterium]|nr:DUF3644 domain-containing protein [Thermoguttaceae bacterium]